MVQFTGKYQHIRNDNFVPHLIALGFSEAAAKMANEANYTVELIVEGDKIVIIAESLFEGVTNTLIVGQEVEEKAAGMTLKSTARIEGHTITVDSTTPSGIKYTRVHKFTDSGFEICSSSADGSVPEATRYYIRV